MWYDNWDPYAYLQIVTWVASYYHYPLEICPNPTYDSYIIMWQTIGHDNCYDAIGFITITNSITSMIVF